MRMPPWLRGRHMSASPTSAEPVEFTVAYTDEGTIVVPRDPMPGMSGAIAGIYAEGHAVVEGE